MVADIGDGSCSAQSACQGGTGDIGDGSCNAQSACQGGSGDIGDYSCNGTTACAGVNEDIPDCTENEVAIECPEPTVAPDHGGARRPNIGAGLSGLFTGQPTPLPTAPSAAAPPATSPITPPRTGDGGLVDAKSIVDRGFVTGAVAVLALSGVALWRQRES
jgi:hypothetical protein